MKSQNPHIAITKETKKRLDKFGIYGDTYNDVINRIIDNLEKEKVKS